MPETRPISKRIDLKYVRKRQWPGNWTWMLSIGTVAALILGGAALELMGNTPGSHAHSIYTSGNMTHAHAMFGNDCAQCHAPEPGKSGFWLGVRDDLCLRCHETYATTHVLMKDCKPVQRKYDGTQRVVTGLSQPVLMASMCAACHVEHQGAEHNLNSVDDGVCTQCHANLTRDGYKSGGSASAHADLAPLAQAKTPMTREGGRQ